MSLQIWLPLNGDVENLGLDSTIATSTLGTVSYTDSGKIGKAFISGGDTQVTNGISINSNYVDKLGSTASVAAWVKPLGSHYHYNGTIISSGNWNYNCWAFGVSQDNTKVDVLSGKYNRYINCSVPVGEWTHLVSVYDNGTSKVYKNGEYIGELTNLPAFESDASNLCIGRETYAGGYFGFNGYINDVRIYDHCLTPKEVKELSKALVLHYKLDNASFGQKNLIPDSIYNNAPWVTAIIDRLDFEGRYATIVRPNILYNQTTTASTPIDLFPGIVYEEDTQYTLSIDWRDDYRTDGKSTGFRIIMVYTDDTSSLINSSSPQIYGRYYWTHTSLTSTSGKTISRIRASYGNGGGMYIANLKLEKGAVDTGYAPSDDIPVYDCSGYNHQTSKNNVTPNSDSPRYSKSMAFSGSSSYVKINDNTWMAQYAPEMTINLWAYASDWTTETDGGRLFSCTETGGFNVEGGASGYWRFSRYVATNAEHTSHAYKYNNSGIKLADLTSGWHMFTFVYSPEGERLYVDGMLHSSYSQVSYGIKFNTSARLFLGCEASTANPGGSVFAGKESDFRLYYTALSSDDILELYNTMASTDRAGNLYAREVVEE